MASQTDNEKALQAKHLVELEKARKQIHTPDLALAWLLEFAQVDLDKMLPSERAAHAYRTDAFEKFGNFERRRAQFSERVWAGPAVGVFQQPKLDDLRHLQAKVHKTFHRLTLSGYATLEVTKWRGEIEVRRGKVYASEWTPDGFVFNLFRLLQRYAGRLRRCTASLPRSELRCHRLFLAARKDSRYCSHGCKSRMGMRTIRRSDSRSRKER